MVPMNKDFTFTPPPEAPVFRPTEEQFRNPLDYIMQIRHIGTKTGICKIIPPKGWNPPFAVNMKEFSFTPRIQRLYELEAHSRIKLNFISRLYKYVRSQGGDRIRVPSIGGRFLDLHALYKMVHECGGYEKVCVDHLWSTVTERLDYPTKFTYSVKSNYEKLLLAFDRFISADSSKKRFDSRARDTKRPRMSSGLDTEVDFSTNKELRNLRFFGPGPKTTALLSDQSKTYLPQMGKRTSVEDFRCRSCGRGDDENCLLVCASESCQACYHLYCLQPPLRTIPKFRWRCPECIRAEFLKSPDLYGFPQSSKTYSLHEFGVMADEFKSTYFGRPCTEIPCSIVEQEFWRILQEYNDDVVVEYGADVHSSAQGSGFPTISRLKNLVGTAQQLEDAKMYALNPWNLNILPLLDRSILRFIKGNIDGMKIPWCYVGMVFSSFCWHIEDHWSYSINFNHWGEPKTWYGVSRLNADEFERAMRKHASELFEQAPDLLHHITTNMNPNIIQAEGVPIYRTDQHCGEFVITFPRAYHSGFNQGFNFAEAVNICPPDWLPIGRACVEHYAEMKRHCVFSNDELLCTLAEVAGGRRRPEEVLMLTNPCSSPLPNHTLSATGLPAANPNLPPGCSTAGLDIGAISIVRDEFTLLLAKERRLRQTALNLGVKRMEKVNFDELPDEVRVCDVCMTTLFLSAVSCLCDADVLSSTVQPVFKNADGSGSTKRKHKSAPVGIIQSDESGAAESSEDMGHQRRFVVCLAHCDELCSSCEPALWSLKYHYTIEELEKLDVALSDCLANFYAWRDSVTRILKCAESCMNSKDKSDKTKPLCIVEKDPDDCTVSSSHSTSDGCVMSLRQLRDTLTSGRCAGYHTEDIYTEAEIIVKRAEHLVHICSLINSAVSTCEDPSGKFPDSEPSSTNLVRFQFRLPAMLGAVGSSADSSKHASNLTVVSLQHEMDVNNPRELDLIRLSEACKQLHPVDVMREPDVQSITDLLFRLDEWRQCARDTISSVCQLSITNATRSLTMNCASTVLTSLALTAGSKVTRQQTGDLSVDEQVLMLLSDLLKRDRPLFVSRLPEWNSLMLLYRAIRWLYMYQKQMDANDHSWTLPTLRQHWTRGAYILTQFNGASGNGVVDFSKVNASLRPSASVSSTSSLSLEAIMAPVSRLVKARMHTTLGLISQSIVQVESLVTILIDALSVSESFSCPEVIVVLEQLGLLKINHLIAWNIVKRNVEKPPGTDNDRDLLQLDDEPVSVLNLPHPDTLLRLRDVLVKRLHCLLTSATSSTTVVCRPQLEEAKVLLSLGLLMGNVTPSSTDEICSVDYRFDLENAGVLTQHLDQLKNVVHVTNMAVDHLCKTLLGDDLPDHADNVLLIKCLLPKFPSATLDDECFREFMDAYSSSPQCSVTVYNQFAERSRSTIETLLNDLLNAAVLCPDCSEKFGLQGVTNELKEKECLFCPVVSNTTLAVTQTTLADLKQQWFSQDPSSSQPVLLCTPQAVAVQLYWERVKGWTEKLVTILKSNATTFGMVGQMEEDVQTVLPTSLQFMKSQLNFEKDMRSTCTADTTDLVSQLRQHLGYGYSLSVGLGDYLVFLRHFLTTIIPTST